MSGGGGSSSSKGGGLKDGLRSKCIGRGIWLGLGSLCMCAAGGRMILRLSTGAGSATLSILEEESLFGGGGFIMGKDEGELRRRGAPGHPQEECSVSNVVDSGEV